MGRKTLYIRQAIFSALGILSAVGALVYVFDHGGSGWWLLIAYLAATIPSGPMMMRTLDVIGAAIGVQDEPLVVIGLAIALLFLPVLAVVFLAVSLVQAAQTA